MRQVIHESAAYKTGCRPGDVVYAVNNVPVWDTELETIETLLQVDPPIKLEMVRPCLADTLYLRETPASQSALEPFSGPGADVTQLVPELSERFGEAPIFMSERLPMLFAGDGGTASHVHIDRQPLIQFCHIVHGTKFFGVAPSSTSSHPYTAGSVVPWESTEERTTPSEVSLPVDKEMPIAAQKWLQRPEVSIAAVQTGDLLLFPGRSIHFGANALGGLCLALFHGAQSIDDMANGIFGPGQQALAAKWLSQKTA